MAHTLEAEAERSRGVVEGSLGCITRPCVYNTAHGLYLMLTIKISNTSPNLIKIFKYTPNRSQI